MEYVETRPSDSVPPAGGVPATVVVTMELESLLGDLKAASLDTDGRISAGEARQLACRTDRPQRPRVMLTRLLQQIGDSRLRDPCLHSSRQCVDRVDDHPRLLGHQPTLSQRRTDRLMALQRLSQPDRAMSLSPGRARVMGPPTRRRHRPRIRTSSHSVGMTQHPHQQLIHLRPRPGERHQHLARLTSRHRPRRRPRHGAQRLTTRLDTSPPCARASLWAICGHRVARDATASRPLGTLPK